MGEDPGKIRLCLAVSVGDTDLVMRTWVGSMLDVVYPPRCRACGVWGRLGHAEVCDGCACRLAEQFGSPCCPRCGGRVGSFALIEGRCQECRDLSGAVVQTARVGPYEGLLRDLVLAFKFRGSEGLAPVLSEWMAAAIRSHDWLGQVEAVTFVPAHWRRQWWRSVHPARSLAAQAALDLAKPFVPVLRRVHARSRQVGLSYAARQANVRGAFAMARGVRLTGARLLLVDDVRTTGATLEECARVLRRGGASAVYAAVVCKADW